MNLIKGLYHAAYQCRDTAETRSFYEGFLGRPLIDAFEITTTQTGRRNGSSAFVLCHE